jgi:putative DNA primase/helicase
MAEYSGNFRLYKLSDFRPLPAMRWFIKGLIPRHGVALLYGEGKVAKKTFLGLSMAYAIAVGLLEWCGHPVTKGKVLLIVGEGFNGVLRRLTALEKLYGVEVGDNLRLLPMPVNFYDKDKVDEALLAFKAQGFEPDFVMIDTLARSMSGGKEKRHRGHDQGVRVDGLLPGSVGGGGSSQGLE